MTPGIKVAITEGKFKGHIGKVVSNIANQRLAVRLDFIQHFTMIFFSVSHLRVLKDEEVLLQNIYRRYMSIRHEAFGECAILLENCRTMAEVATFLDELRARIKIIEKQLYE